MSLVNCTDCPRMCGANRRERPGACGATSTPYVARAALHFWEEPPISGRAGSGTIFFCGCNLSCVFCQNADISTAQIGKSMNAELLAERYLLLESQGAHNINLVTPTPHVEVIRDSILIARRNGLCIPIVWNSNGYERVCVLQTLEGLIDIYLPDFKYVSSALSKRYSGAEDYAAFAVQAIGEMQRQVGVLQIKDSIARRGLLLRHLILPGSGDEARSVLDTVAGMLPKETHISLMRQYTPAHRALSEPERFAFLTRRLTSREYNRVLDYALSLGFENLYTQSAESADSAFTPPFDGTGTSSSPTTTED